MATEKTRNSRETSARRLAESLLVTWLAARLSLGWKPVGHSDDADDNDDDDDNHDDVDADDDADDRFFPSCEKHHTYIAAIRFVGRTRYVD